MKEGWEIKKLGEVSTFINGDRGKNYPSQNDFVNNGIPFINAGHLMDGEINFTSMNYISEEKYNQLGSGKMVDGDLLFCLRGSLGKRAIVKNINCGAIASSLVIIRSKSIHNKYLYHYLGSPKVSELVVKSNNGSSQPNLSAKSVSQFLIPVPPIAEQEKIVAELDCLSGIIEKKKQQLKEYDALAQSIFYEMFGNPVDNEKGWNTKRVEEICDVYRGGSPRPIEKFLGGNIPWIKIGDATQGDSIYLTKTKEHIIEEGLKKTRFIHSGSLIFANCGVSLGFARIITFDGCIHDGWLAFDNVSDEIEKIFFLKSINFCTQYFRSIAPDGVQPNLNTTIMKAFMQILPPLELQKRFVEIIKNIEKQKLLVAKSLEEVETLFNSRMDYYFN